MSGSSGRFRRLTGGTGVAVAAVMALSISAPGPSGATGARPTGSQDDSRGGGEAATVVLHEGTDLDATMSPDGSTIVFGLQDGLWRMSGKGGKATRLNKPREDFTRPDYSPNGKRVIFQAYNDNNFHLMSMRPDGTHRRELTSSQYDDRGPVYSPDGTKVAFASDRTGNYDIWVLDLASGALKQLTNDPSSQYEPTWSPDGKRIAYTVGLAADAHTIDAVAADGTTQTLVKQPRGQVRAPSWSPNGKQIAYTLEVSGRNKLYVADTASGATKAGRQVSGVGEDVFGFPARWLSNNRLLYSSDGKIQSRNVRQGRRRMIPFTAKISFDRPAYHYKKHLFGDQRPAEKVQGIVAPSMSPDRSQVAFVALNDLWLMKVGKRPHRVTHDRFKELSPTWSPDGSQLAYSSDRDGLEQIYIRTLSTGAERQLTTASGANAVENAYRATWCPGDTTHGKIAFQTGLGVFAPPATHVADVGTGKVTKVAQLSTQFEPGRPTWGPGCHTLAMAALSPASARFRQGWNQIRVADLNSGDAYWVDPEKFQNISSRTSGNGPVWSPDGTKMAYVRDSVLAVVPVGPDGRTTGPPQPITKDNADYIGWTDSDHLMYLSNGNLRTVDATGGSRTSVPLDLNWHTAVHRGLTLIKAGRLWDGTSPRVRRNVYVLVRKDRIVGVVPDAGNARRTAVPRTAGVAGRTSIAALKRQRGVRFVDASGLTVMPGLIEGHMHREWVPYLGSREGRQLLSYGITSTISLGDPAYNSLASEEATLSGHEVAPRAFTTGEHLNGSRIYYGFMRTTSNKRALRHELNRIKALDMNALKTYVRLPNEYQIIANKFAHRLGIPTFSHYFYPSLGFGQDDMAHLSATQRWEFSHTVSAGGFTYADVVKLAVASKMAITTTPFASTTLLNYAPDVLNDPRITTLYAPWQRKDLQATYDDVTTTDQSVARRGLRQEEQVLHKILQRGGHIWAGTDEPLAHVAESLHETLRAEVRYGGFTPYQALRTATVIPAGDIGVGKDLGTIQAGKIADISFVKGNPLRHISDTERVQMVMTDGHLHTVNQLLRPFK